MTPLPLITAIQQEKHQEIQDVLKKQPALVNVTDEHGNTPLHYAVAQQDIESIKLLLAVPNLNPSYKNNHGESALEWYQEYVGMSLCKTSIFLKKLRILPSIFRTNDKDSLEFFREEFERIPVVAMRFLGGDNLLHLSVRYGDSSLIKPVFNKLNDRRCCNLLYSKNFIGDTPLLLAQKLQQQGKLKADILLLLQQKLQSIPANLRQQPTIETLPDITLNLGKVAQLREYLSKEITQKDWQKINSLLPTLVSLCYFTCCLALMQCNELLHSAKSGDCNSQAPPISWERFNHVQWLRRQAIRLFNDYLWYSDKEVIVKVQKQILSIATYLADILQQGKVNQVIQLVEALPLPEIYSKPTQTACSDGLNRIVCKFIGKRPLLYSIMTILHESAHIVLQSYDFVYYERNFDLPGTFYVPIKEKIIPKFNFTDLYQKELLELQHSLEVCSGSNETRTQWISRHNADAMSFLTALLGANYSGFTIYIPRFDRNSERAVSIVIGKDRFLSDSHIKQFTMAQQQKTDQLLQPAKLLTEKRARDQDILYMPNQQLSQLEIFSETHDLSKFMQGLAASPDMSMGSARMVFDQIIDKMHELEHSHILNSVPSDSLVC